GTVKTSPAPAMEQLTPEGLKVVNELAQRYGFSQEAVIQMMFAMLRGRGGMAQFNHPEFAGSGQWMQGGMLMLGDMFNHALKARVDGLCQAIASQLASQPELFPAGSFQAQSQSGGSQQMQVGGGQQMQVAGSGQQMQVGGGGQQMQVSGVAQPLHVASAGHGLFAPDPRDTWWPRELGQPSAMGQQNDVRYAFFPALGRLAVETNGQVSVYDTGGHHIAGFGQQQAPGGAVVFSTPAGSISLASLSSVAGGTAQQAQSSSGGSQQQQQVSGIGPAPTGLAPMAAMAPMGGMAAMSEMAPMAFQPMAAAQPWWPPELGTPSATGAQNTLRYAVFPAARRLVVELDGRLSQHDCGELQITGCSQDSGASGVSFTTSSGTIPLANLPEVPPTARAAAEMHPPGPPASTDPPTSAVSPTPAAASPPRESNQAMVLDALAKLGALKEQGILTPEEFDAKKAELLSRL
ncbi:MAG: SHOCT domain-containing protein, partial [Cyanobacteriota bacterium]|nr:SHOCT domain-containing protein [Cyanobacteriota bacterium]